jgi:hypothetical protein
MILEYKLQDCTTDSSICHKALQHWHLEIDAQADWLISIIQEMEFEIEFESSHNSFTCHLNDVLSTS